jgi:hypothetical protein
MWKSGPKALPAGLRRCFSGCTRGLRAPGWRPSATTRAFLRENTGILGWNIRFCYESFRQPARGGLKGYSGQRHLWGPTPCGIIAGTGALSRLYGTRKGLKRKYLCAGPPGTQDWSGKPGFRRFGKKRRKCAQNRKVKTL